MAKKNDACMQVEGDNNIRSIKKFNGMNFQIWKFQLTIIFCAKKLMEIVEGTQTLEEVIDVKKWRKRDNTTMMLACSTIDEKHMNVLINCKTIATRWHHLIIVHEQNAMENKHIM